MCMWPLLLLLLLLLLLGEWHALWANQSATARGLGVLDPLDGSFGPFKTLTSVVLALAQPHYYKPWVCPHTVGLLLVVNLGAGTKHLLGVGIVGPWGAACGIVCGCIRGWQPHLERNIPE